MIRYLAVVLGIGLSAGAQVLLKRGSFYSTKELLFFAFLGLAAFSYLLSFGVYSYLLKSFPLSRISPIMTLGTMMLAILSGVVFFKDSVSLRYSLGIAFGVVAVVLITK